MRAGCLHTVCNRERAWPLFGLLSLGPAEHGVEASERQINVGSWSKTVTLLLGPAALSTAPEQAQARASRGHSPCVRLWLRKSSQQCCSLRVIIPI